MTETDRRIGPRATAALFALIALSFAAPAAHGQGVVRQRGGLGRPAVNSPAPRTAPPPAAAPASPPAAPTAEPSAPVAPPATLFPGPGAVEEAVSPRGMASTLKVLGLLTVLSLAPAALMMTTCFVRFVVVFGLLRQAIGAQQLPPNQVVVSLCLFLTAAVMAPVWQEAYEDGVRPYTDPAPGEVQPTLEEAFGRTARPIRRFMADQIERAGNSDGVWLFLEYRGEAGGERPQTYDEVPLTVLVPAYMLSELKTAFVIGFQVYLPFLVIDMVVSAVLISMGMMMLPPVLISLPFKLLLFVLIDGWFLTVGMLLESVRPLGG